MIAMFNEKTWDGTFNQLLCLFSIPPSNKAMTVHVCIISNPTGFAVSILTTFVTFALNTRQRNQKFDYFGVVIFYWQHLLEFQVL